MNNEVLCPNIVNDLLQVSHRLAGVDVDKERLCYLVTDMEWEEIIAYSSRFIERERPDVGLSTMRFAGLEVIKRSALNRGEPTK